MKQANRLLDKVALVTGASSGIGRAAALALAAEGAAVAVHFHTGADRATDVVSRIVEAGGKAIALGADITVDADRRALVTAVERQLGPLDVLVNNAGGPIARARFDEVDETLLDRALDLNFKAPFLLAKESLLQLERSRGAIVNISTAVTRRPGSGGSIHYAAAKGALNVMTMYLAAELAPRGVRVNSVAPGPVASELHARLSSPERLRTSAEATLMKRMGSPEEIAAAIVFLASAESAYMTGQTIYVDGG